MKVYPRRINEIVHGKRSVTADTALRLARYFGTSTEVWMNLQTLYDLETARDELVEEHPFFNMNPDGPTVEEEMEMLRGGRYRDI